MFIRKFYPVCSLSKLSSLPIQHHTTQTLAVIVSPDTLVSTSPHVEWTLSDRQRWLWPTPSCGCCRRPAMPTPLGPLYIGCLDDTQTSTLSSSSNTCRNRRRRNPDSSDPQPVSSKTTHTQLSVTMHTYVSLYDDQSNSAICTAKLASLSTVGLPGRLFTRNLHFYANRLHKEIYINVQVCKHNTFITCGVLFSAVFVNGMCAPIHMCICVFINMTIMYCSTCHRDFFHCIIHSTARSFGKFQKNVKTLSHGSITFRWQIPIWVHCREPYQLITFS